MKHFKTAALLLAPPLLMGGFAFYLSRAPGHKPATFIYGPFTVSVAGIEQSSVKPLDVFEGYDRKFNIVFDATGRRPAWWGTKISGSTGVEAKNWKFFLERDGVITPFTPSKTLIWTSNWDEARKRYTNTLFLKSGDVPLNSALKVRCVTALSDNKTKLSPPLPFEFTLKKAGEQWTKPIVSTATGLVIRKITVKRVGIYGRVAEITVFDPHSKDKMGWQDGGGFLDGNWREFEHLQINNDAWKGFNSAIPHSFGGGSPMDTSDKLSQYEFTWNVAEMKGEPRRDVIAVAHVSSGGRWPLEIAFYAKKDGQQALGVVPALTRPAPTR